MNPYGSEPTNPYGTEPQGPSDPYSGTEPQGPSDPYSGTEPQGPSNPYAGEPQAPTNPYASEPQDMGSQPTQGVDDPYGQPAQDPYGQPIGASQDPYGQPAGPGPAQNSYGQPGPTPYGQPQSGPKPYGQNSNSFNSGSPYGNPTVNQYGGNAYSMPPQKSTPGEGKAIGGIICSVLSILFCSLCFGVILAPVGMVLSKGAMNEGYEGGLAKAGWIVGIVGLVLNVLVIIFWIAMFALGMSEY